MKNFRVIETRRGFYVEQSYLRHGATVWGGRIGPIPTRQEAEELLIEIRVDMAIYAESAAEAGLRYVGA